MIEPSAFLEHWLGHRRLTRRMVDAFHPDQLFTYSPAPPLRPFGEMVWEVAGQSSYTLDGLLNDDFGAHFGARGRVVLLGVESAESRQVQRETGVTVVRTIRSKRARSPSYTLPLRTPDVDLNT